MTDRSPSARQAYRKLSEDFMELMGIKVGSTVKVTHTVEPYAFGWPSNWTEVMDTYVGKEFTVERIDSTDKDFALRADGFSSNYYFPFFVLQVVKPKEIRIKLESGDYEVLVKDDGSIEVGCQKISRKKLTEIYQASSKKLI